MAKRIKMLSSANGAHPVKHAWDAIPNRNVLRAPVRRHCDAATHIRLLGGATNWLSSDPLHAQY
jgi:hypothetical protein